MEKSEAIQVLNNIKAVIESNNRAFVNPKQMTILGVGVIMVPLTEGLINLTTIDQILATTVGHQGIAILRAIFYGTIFYLLERKFAHKKNSTINPLIKKAFKISFIFSFACISLGLGLYSIGMAKLVYPILFLFMALIFNLFGKFINKSYTWVSWLFLVTSPVYLYLTQFNIDGLWMLFMSLHGLSYIFIAVYSKHFDSSTDIAEGYQDAY